MPLMTLDLPPDLYARVLRAQAESGHTLEHTVMGLILDGMAARLARSRGGHTRWAGTTLEQRRAMMAKAREASIVARTGTRRREE